MAKLGVIVRRLNSIENLGAEQKVDEVPYDFVRKCLSVVVAHEVGGPAGSSIRNYMVRFGLISSLFDMLTFGVLLWLFRASPEEFRTGWFLKSLLNELVIALVVRTRRPFYRSRPGNLLLGSSACVIMLALVGLTLAYVLVVELAKNSFYGRAENANR